ncbi:GNAT family N-acetyltransferase [Kitasatospora sp. NPDC094015]|uniref:GNAT family N-acetyltransferase n=1 Tax=Kitasatospora sp. NPDC094015 TaxID=3155205 RepID=UPI00331D7141
MEKITTRPTAAATPSGPALVLRPWGPADAADLVGLARDEALRRWTSFAVHDEASAARWIEEQQRGQEAGDRLAFAVLMSEPAGGEGRLAGHVVLKGAVPGASSAEVGYWTAPHARGLGVAPRALDALTDWAFDLFPGAGPTSLELVHQVDNTASCRVAQKCRYELSAVLPSAPPAHPRTGHLHIRPRNH